MHWMYGSIVLVVLAVGTAACGDRGGSAARGGMPVAGGTAVVCSQAAPERLDAFITPDQFAADLRLLISTPLVVYDGHGGFSPRLATSWHWSPDHRVLTLHVRRDVRWHDGQPVTAEDVAWTVQRAAREEYGYWDQPAFASLASAQASGDSVELRFKEALAGDLEPLAALTVLPRHLLEKLSPGDFREAPYHRDPVSNGPFRVVTRGGDGALVLERVVDYPAALGTPRLQRVVVRVIQEPMTMLTELRTGGVDLCLGGSALAAQASAARAVLRVLPLEPAGVQAIPLNTRIAPLSDPRVRRALSAAIRRSDVATAVSPLARPRRTFFPISSPYADTLIGQTDADPARAAALLDSAGYARIGPDGIRVDAAGRPLRFELVAPQPLRPAVEVVQAQLRRVGVDAQLRFMEWAAYLSLIRHPAGRPAAMALAIYPDRLIEPDYQDVYASQGGSNLTSYANPAVDTLVSRLRVALEPGQRRTLYRELQRRIIADAPMLYLVASPRVVIVGPRLHDVAVDVNGPFAGVARWWVPQRAR